MTVKRCQECGKNSYSDVSVFRAAINSARTLGKGMRYYPCPYRPGVFHLTSKRKEERT